MLLNFHGADNLLQRVHSGQEEVTNPPSPASGQRSA